MQLNQLDKNLIREYIEGRICEIPDEQRLQLDKEILEPLLFETITINKEKGIKLKVPIWSGNFLKKIDLSQVDFTNVSWGIQGMDEDSPYSIDINGLDVDPTVNKRIKGIIAKGAKKYDEKEHKEHTEEDGEEKDDKITYLVDYSGTNANIDLTQSFEALNEGVIEARLCNFSGLDFSKTDLSKCREISFDVVDLSGTKLVIPNPNKSKLKAYCSNFDGLDLSSRTINGNKYFDSDTSENLPQCNLHNTAINITLEPNGLDESDKEDIKTVMERNWVGCYVNNTKIHSKEEREQYADSLKKQYDEFKDNEMNNIIGNIRNQIEGMKKR